MLTDQHGEKRPQADLRQPTLPGLDAGSLSRPQSRSDPQQDDQGAAGAPPPPVECLWACQGTTRCLCGQGELSDDPLWIENE